MALKWTDELVEIEARKHKTRASFKRSCSGAYKAAVRNGTLDSVCAHMSVVLRNWTNDELACVAKTYKTRGDFQRGDGSAYNIALRRDIMDSICSHMVIRVRTSKWTKSKLAEVSKNYTTRREFQVNAKGAYQSAYAQGLLDEICSHMDQIREEWTVDKLAKEAKKYNTRADFARFNLGAYSSASKRGIMDSICGHMVEGKGGFKETKGGILYQFRIVSGRKVYYKVGISNRDPLRRAYGFGVKEGVYIELIHYIEFENGAECRQMERELHAAAKAKGLQYIGKDLMKSGFTEIFTKPLLH
jgi:hypothetical protein